VEVGENLFVAVRVSLGWKFKVLIGWATF